MTYDPYRNLSTKWRMEAQRHQRAADEINYGPEWSDRDIDEIRMHEEAASVLRKCAEELDLLQ